MTSYTKKYMNIKKDVPPKNRKMSYSLKICSGRFSSSTKNIPNWNKIRKEILDRDGYCCRICGEEHILNVHHIDWNRKNNKNSNLVTVCSNCHRLIHFERYFPWEHEEHPCPWGYIEEDE